MPARRPAAAKTAWWLSPGEDLCPHCGEPYLYELEFRCVECDGPACMHCKTLHVEGHAVCPACASAAQRRREAPARGRRHGR